MTSLARNFQKTLGEIAAIASSSLPRDAQVNEILSSLEREVPVAAANFLVVSHDSSLKSRFSAGYSRRMLAHLESKSYQRDLSALRLFSRARSLRFNDVQWDEEPGLNVLSCCIHEEGYRDCVTTPLVNSSGRLVGFQNLSFVEAGSIDEDVRGFLDNASTAVANLLDPISFRNIVSQDESDIKSVFAIDSSGTVLTLHGADGVWLKQDGIAEKAWVRAGAGASAGASNWLVRGKDGLRSVRVWSTGAPYFGGHGNHLILCDLGHATPPLTLRELEVARLVAEGKRSVDVAHNLGITLRTANAHVEAMLTKLGATNRAAAAAEIVRHGWRLLC
ncbi:response regulator transcription factor [Thalassovita aquimarina]|uniref:Helix-turn-helix transcriptional regulator n=1 Tax=Thalassovita aquimarina TaxID=2785917 RepID=A0ABS5HWN9_9RHOB|nr:helix-turn-helix transcriptional regulator [Thalassovita aquimarina]MBR9653415.1 helix-turn-helix transcriptional regulator [Thalassovita aquimarina]